MLKEYNPNAEMGVHVIRYTFMCWDCVGHIVKRVGGNCKGASLLFDNFWEDDTQEDIDHYAENDCRFSYNEELDMYTAYLTNEAGDTLEVEWEPDEVADSIVAVEFIDYIKGE